MTNTQKWAEAFRTKAARTVDRGTQQQYIAGLLRMWFHGSCSNFTVKRSCNYAAWPTLTFYNEVRCKICQSIFGHLLLHTETGWGENDSDPCLQCCSEELPCLDTATLHLKCMSLLQPTKNMLQWRGFARQYGLQCLRHSFCYNVRIQERVQTSSIWGWTPERHTTGAASSPSDAFANKGG